MFSTKKLHSKFETFLLNSSDLFLSKETEALLNELKGSLSTDSQLINRNKYFKEIIKHGGKEFFLIKGIKHFPYIGPSIILVPKNKKAIMFLALNSTKQKFLDLYDSPEIISLLHIHSYKKGEGKKLMEVFLQIQRSLDIPGSLYTESIELVDYYKKYGFINLGKLGRNTWGIRSQYLMKLP
ncbi:hypothetical protein ABEW34_21710 [Paenibacillus algorifonticola]|uniref:hypothetical protein n=1 Tax=Paenibacillus algorifonticola TaxID=684063 RepID=UPI003D2B982B